MNHRQRVSYHEHRDRKGCLCGDQQASKVLGDFLPALDDHTEGKLYHDIEDSFGILAFGCGASVISFEVVFLV